MENGENSECGLTDVSKQGEENIDDISQRKLICVDGTSESQPNAEAVVESLEKGESQVVNGPCSNTSLSPKFNEPVNCETGEKSEVCLEGSPTDIVDFGVSELPSPLKYQVPPISLSEEPNCINYFNGSSPKKTLEDLQESKELVCKLQNELERIKKEVSVDKDNHYTEVQALHRALLAHNKASREKEETSRKTIAQLQQDLKNKQKELDGAMRERDTMVIKYASSESNVIKANEKCEQAEKRLQEVSKTCEAMTEKMKIFQKERDNAVAQFDVKGQEIASLHKDVARWKEEANARETKLKWANNKLASEKERHKDTEQKNENLVRKLEETRQELEQVRKDSQATLRSLQESQENKAITLGHQLKEHQARLIIERHEREDKEESQRQLQNEVESLKCKQILLITENNQLSVKVQSLEKERLEYEQKLSRLKKTCDEQQEMIVNLQNQVSEMENLRIQLNHCDERLSASQSEVERLRQSNVELQEDMIACRRRDAEMLEFTQKLTEKNVRLQSEFSATEAKAQLLESEQGPLQKRLAELEAREKELNAKVSREHEARQEEVTLVTKHLAERTHAAQQFSQQVEDLKAENEVLHRKHSAALRELNRELQQCRKKLESLDPGCASGNVSPGHGSRASSTSSLNTVGDVSVVPTQAQHSPLTPQVLSGSEPEKQVLVDRLVKLQRENARKAEKLDFLEEHTQQLLAELQKKTRIIQNYVIKTPAGALTSDSMDHNKAESAKRSGIMASMHGSKIDESMTIELSMEINRKLQLVLEDTLLKNITLKESIDTLGTEIARLSKEKQRQP